MNSLSIRKIIITVAFLTLTTHAATPPLFSGGDGSASSPYLIASASDLAALASLVNAPATNVSFAGKHYRLASDIDLSGYANWTPIGIGLIRSNAGDDRLIFRGVFDGAGKSVANLKITSAVRIADSFQGSGLFGVVDGGTVKNVRLSSVNIGIKAGRAGGVAGAAVAGGVIKDCYVLGSIGGSGSVGGIVGHIDDSSAVVNCYVVGSVSGTDRVGGVAGYVYNSVVTGSYAVGKVNEGDSAVSTAAGHVWNSVIAESGVFDPETDVEAMLKVVPEHILDGVVADVKNAPPIVAVTIELADRITAGPNPVNRLLGSVNFFRNGTKLKKGGLSVYNSQGKVTKRISTADMSIGVNDKSWRQVGTWDLKDRKGRIVSEGAYAVKGVLFTMDGKKEKILIPLWVK